MEKAAFLCPDSVFIWIICDYTFGKTDKIRKLIYTNDYFLFIVNVLE